MSLRRVPPGSVIERIYYAVPSHYTIGETFDDWAEAQRHAQARHAKLVALLTDSLAGYASPSEIAARSQVRVDLRWVIRQPDGTEYDTIVERFPVTEETT